MYYSFVGINPTFITHFGTLDGTAPVPFTPVISAGRAVFNGLTSGGLISFNKKPVIIRTLEGTGITWAIVDATGAVVRATPTSFPFRLSGGESLRATGGQSAGVLVQMDGWEL